MGEMRRKLQFYADHGVEDFDGWTRRDGQLQSIEFSTTYVSPRLNVRFELQPQDFVIYRPDEQPFLRLLDLDRLQQQAAKLAAKLQELGIDPSSL
jgi:hypothetical protein